MDLGSIPGLGRSPRRREQHPIPVFFPGEFHGQRGIQSMGSQRVRHNWATNTTITTVSSACYVQPSSSRCLQMTAPGDTEARLSQCFKKQAGRGQPSTSNAAGWAASKWDENIIYLGLLSIRGLRRSWQEEFEWCEDGGKMGPGKAGWAGKKGQVLWPEILFLWWEEWTHGVSRKAEEGSWWSQDRLHEPLGSCLRKGMGWSTSRVTEGSLGPSQFPPASAHLATDVKLPRLPRLVQEASSPPHLRDQRWGSKAYVTPRMAHDHWRENGRPLGWFRGTG